MKNQITKFLLDCPAKMRQRKIKVNDDFCEWLNREYPKVSLAGQINAVLTSSSPYCSVCGEPVKTVGKKTCSLQCRSKIVDTDERVKKQKETLRKKYGVDNIRKIDGAENRRKESMIRKYGALVSAVTRQKAKERSGDLQTKGRKTLTENYGVMNPSQLADHREKCISTLTEHYQVSNYFLSAEFKKKSIDQAASKWGSFVPNTIEILEIADPSESKTANFDNPNKLIKFKCTVCNSVEEVPSETVKWRIQNTGTCCYSCSGMSKGSVMENDVRKFIHSLGFSTLNNSRDLISGKEIDIFVSEKNVGIEFNGLFWHNDLRVSKHYHLEKLNLATSKGIRLVQIFEDEWLHQPDVVKSRLKNILGITGKKVFARKCSVKEISFNEERDFLSKKHLQGHSKSSVKLGLFHNSELLSVMTFSKPNISKGQKSEPGFWELLRFANDIDTTVIGGASKLLQHFITIYSPSKIISFADKRWSQGNLYSKLGFTFVADTTENYWYINSRDVKRIHRFSMRKNKDDDQAKTEYVNRLDQGYLRIWDCGSSKWVWTANS